MMLVSWRLINSTNLISFELHQFPIPFSEYPERIFLHHIFLQTLFRKQREFPSQLQIQGLYLSPKTLSISQCSLIAGNPICVVKVNYSIYVFFTITNIIETRQEADALSTYWVSSKESCSSLTELLTSKINIDALRIFHINEY